MVKTPHRDWPRGFVHLWDRLPQERYFQDPEVFQITHLEYHVQFWDPQHIKDMGLLDVGEDPEEGHEG